MSILNIPKLSSLGIIPSYQCSNRCRHCLYASSAEFRDWMDEESMHKICSGLAKHRDYLSGIHIGGGEPLLRVDITSKLIQTILEYNLPLEYVETNAFWCWSEAKTESVFQMLKEAGLRAILISVSPFHLEYVPMERTNRAIKIAQKVFGAYGVLIYTQRFFQQFQEIDPKHTVAFEDYVEELGIETAALEISGNYSLIPNGRVSTELLDLYERKPIQDVFGDTCKNELSSPHHAHIDLYGNYIAGLCAGITLGDAFDLDSIYSGIDLDQSPFLKNLVEGGVEALFHWAQAEYGYEELEGGYIAKCHLCLDIRRHLVNVGDFKDLAPKQFYENL